METPHTLTDWMESNSVSRDNGIIVLYIKMSSATAKIVVTLFTAALELKPWWMFFFFFFRQPWNRPKSDSKEKDTLDGGNQLQCSKLVYPVVNTAVK